MPDGIPLFITGAFDIMSVDELELGVMSGTPGCNIPEPVGGVTETGGVFIVELPCAPGACYNNNHNYNKIVKSDWLSTALISALIGQLIGQYASCLSNWTVRAITRTLKWLFFSLLA